MFRQENWYDISGKFSQIEVNKMGYNPPSARFPQSVSGFRFEAVPVK